MDVSVRLSLKGGHHWEFICDEDDPMVFGLISALPGAKLDESLPPDGLVQVESRNGQRFFLSRSSLVAVTVSRVPARQEGIPAPGDLGSSGVLAPTPFVMRADLLDQSAADAVLQAAACSVAGADDGLHEVEMPVLPPEVAQALVGLLAEAETSLVRARCEETHINVAVRRLSRRRTAHIPLPSGSRRLLDFVVFLAATNPAKGSVELSLSDRWVGPDKVTATGRTFSVPFNVGLVLPDVSSLTALALNVAADLDQIVIISGSLCEGVRVAAG